MAYAKKKTTTKKKASLESLSDKMVKKGKIKDRGKQSLAEVLKRGRANIAKRKGMKETKGRK
jgi:polyhydroxyalkanoate synthesis regulator phasin